MERGLLWLPLLGIFIWLAWAGWNEYRKLEAYQTWAADFDRAKYDLYAVLGQRGEHLAWGRPTRQGPTAIQQVSLADISAIALYGGDIPPPRTIDLPRGCQVGLELTLKGGEKYLIPFTDLDLATRWQSQLQSLAESLQSTPQS